MAVPQVTRRKAPLIGDERAMLEGWLEYHRATLLLKCSGLMEEQLKRRAAEPSKLSLLGLVRHMTDVERNWFRRTLAGETGPEAAPLYWNREQPDAEFDDVDKADPEEAFAAFSAEVECSRELAAGVALDTKVSIFSVRWIFLHMIEEYARHNGHADLLRERIDGSIGE